MKKIKFILLIILFTGPPGVSIEDAYVQLFPINKQKCHHIDPVRDITFQLFTRQVNYLLIIVFNHFANVVIVIGFVT